MEVRLQHHTGGTCASMVAWLDEAQAAELHQMVRHRCTDAARRLLGDADIDLPSDFDLEYPHWRTPLLRELGARLEEDTNDEDTTMVVPDYARFATDLREIDRHQALIEKLQREADVDLGAAFGWED